MNDSQEEEAGRNVGLLEIEELHHQPLLNTTRNFDKEFTVISSFYFGLKTFIFSKTCVSNRET